MRVGEGPVFYWLLLAALVLGVAIFLALELFIPPADIYSLEPGNLR